MRYAIQASLWLIVMTMLWPASAMVIEMVVKEVVTVQEILQQAPSRTIIENQLATVTPPAPDAPQESALAGCALTMTVVAAGQTVSYTRFASTTQAFVNTVAPNYIVAFPHNSTSGQPQRCDMMNVCLDVAFAADESSDGYPSVSFWEVLDADGMVYLWGCLAWDAVVTNPIPWVPYAPIGRNVIYAFAS